MDIAGYVEFDAVFAYATERYTGVLPATKDSACADSNINTCEPVSAYKPEGSETCFLFSSPIDFRNNVAVNPQTGWIKYGAVATVKGVVTTAGPAIPTSSPSPSPSPSLIQYSTATSKADSASSSSLPTDMPVEQKEQPSKLSPALIGIIAGGIIVFLGIAALIVVLRKKMTTAKPQIPLPLLPEDPEPMAGRGFAEDILGQAVPSYPSGSVHQPEPRKDAIEPLVGTLSHPPVGSSAAVTETKGSMPLVNIGMEDGDGGWRVADGEGAASSVAPPAYDMDHEVMGVSRERKTVYRPREKRNIK
ncbi:hypothetical protein HDU97_004105 [Phlyctochytrium planicorne]|nr:hypothetical protein HDU97_004105 [Phlyctochytrium planicorne]